MVASLNWVMLSYRVPREPSTPRIAVWRRVKALGVAQMGDGLVALPYDAATKESLEWVAHSIIEAGGEATTWIATPTSRRFGEELAEQLRTDRAAEYRDLLVRISELAETGSPDRRSVRAVRRQLRRIERRDHFHPAERQIAAEAVDALEAVPA